MQTLAFLWFELEVAQQHLRATFTGPQVSAKAQKFGFAKQVGTRPCASAKPVPRMQSAEDPRTTGRGAPEPLPLTTTS
jgi:hypothetical protein